MKQLKPFLLIGCLLAAGIGFLFLPLRQWFWQWQGQLEALGYVGPIVMVIAYIAMTVLLIPGSALTFGASAIFGFWQGLAIVLLGANAGALGAFLLARTTMREKVARWAAEHPQFAALDRAIGQHGFKMVLLARLSPAFPFTLLNYLLGITTVRTSAYVLANLFGMLPGTLLYVYLGATARDALVGNTATGATWPQQILKISGLLATIAVVVVITRVAREALAQAEAEAVVPPNQQAPEARQ